MEEFSLYQNNMKKQQNDCLYSLRTGTIGPSSRIDKIPVPVELLLLMLPSRPSAEYALLPGTFRQHCGRRLLSGHGIDVLDRHLKMRILFFLLYLL